MIPVLRCLASVHGMASDSMPVNANELYQMGYYRKTMRISYLAVSETRCTIQVAGCNFKCRGCFCSEKDGCEKEVTGPQLAGHIPAGKEVMLAGGEPTIDREGLLSLIEALDSVKLILSTNGYLLDEELLKRLEGTTVHIDLKALDNTLHKWYTGRDNQKVLKAVQLLHASGFDFEVSTVYIPGVVEAAEIEKIAVFLSDIGNINYKIIRYVPVAGFSRRPEFGEIENAVMTAGKYLQNVTSSVEHRSHPKGRKVIYMP